jgi:hypothetical protein
MALLGHEKGDIRKYTALVNKTNWGNPWLNKYKRCFLTGFTLLNVAKQPVSRI